MCLQPVYLWRTCCPAQGTVPIFSFEQQFCRYIQSTRWKLYQQFMTIKFIISTRNSRMAATQNSMFLKTDSSKTIPGSMAFIQCLGGIKVLSQSKHLTNIYKFSLKFRKTSSAPFWHIPSVLARLDSAVLNSDVAFILTYAFVYFEVCIIVLQPFQSTWSIRIDKPVWLPCHIHRLHSLYISWFTLFRF